MFSTDRLILRQFEESDLDDMLRMRNQAEVRRVLSYGYLVPSSPSFEQTMRQWVDNALIFLIITLRESGEYLGDCRLDMETSKNRNGRLAISLLQEHQGKGYGEEALRFLIDHAFKQLALHRISLEVFQPNVKAIKLYRKLGFVEEGRVRDGLWMDGGWQDIIAMGILDREWKQQ
ncbi:unnamed protein product [Somion occarium]|uniref:N-acetyltransferase domain-containing protein n=1 Tax=Somion occarium TaxID=3059160 RepID=A0ABP1DZX7_9APHY